MLSSDEKQTLLRNNITPKTKEEILLEHSKRTSTILNDQTRAIQNIYKTQPETAEQRQAQANIQRAKELNNYALSLAQQNDLMALNGNKTNSTYVQSPSVQPLNYSDTSREPTKQQSDIKVLDEKVIASSISSKIEVEGRKLNAFYGIKGEKKEMGQSKPSANIRAVIHGDADIISVVNGSNIKIRLIQDIKINGITVPKNTLITGTCNINGDRLYIGVSTVKIGDDLLPLRVKVVDNDGVDGIYVPNLQVKSQLNQAIARSTDAVNSPGFYSTPSNAPAGQQIIGQIAAQGVSSLIQTGKQILNQKASVAKVSIKSNHQILLIPVQF
jgi:conjugative transposon TraM protein